ncbi:hypothetical protein [uncultured Lacinutrix sp.]|uniref:hypothetical protein n=1 Tax=uncultured Lacinutrix sp. TaxID=574032 RepID=UPI00260DBF55|nr:hypothetical protein [uncultured Lacinutrix sp.]
MKSTITTPDPEPFSIDHNSYSGLLNSNYKEVVKCSFKNRKKPSVFNIRRRLKSNRLSNYCSIETTLKVSVFLFAIMIALF